MILLGTQFFDEPPYELLHIVKTVFYDGGLSPPLLAGEMPTHRLFQPRNHCTDVSVLRQQCCDLGPGLSVKHSSPAIKPHRRWASALQRQNVVVLDLRKIDQCNTQ